MGTSKRWPSVCAAICARQRSPSGSRASPGPRRSAAFSRTFPYPRGIARGGKSVVTCRPMKLACAKFLVSVWAFFGVFVAVAPAFAAGSITWGKTHIQETGGSWHLQMTIVYGGKPSLAHVPMRFSFTPTAFFERYLDDKHGDKPQTRTIPLVGQQPINESVDVDFADTRGKIFDRTKFDFNISRSHNFSAGEYDVIVHRADGAQLGTKTKL